MLNETSHRSTLHQVYVDPGKIALLVAQALSKGGGFPEYTYGGAAS